MKPASPGKDGYPDVLSCYIIFENRYTIHTLRLVTPLLLELLKERRCETGDFFKLAGKMGYAAIVQFIRYFR